MKEQTKNWISLAAIDYKNMLFCWKGKRYRLTVFCAQQAVEKLIKGYIAEYKNVVPPKIHQIERLIKIASLDLEEIESPNVAELSKAYVRVRYEDLDKKYYTRKNQVEPLVSLTKKVYLWIRKKLRDN